MINKDVVQGKWREIKGEIMKSWGELTSDEVEKFKGNVTGLAGELQKKYGIKKEDAEIKLNDIANRFSATANEKVFGDETDKDDSPEYHKNSNPSGYDM
jgi:uncharacterized protein YjbJ (UPF0337 family)